LSTTGISDVAPQQEHTTKAVTYADGTGEVRLKTGDGCTRKPSINPNSDTHLTSQNSNTYRGVAVSPAAPQVLDVAGQGRGTTPFTESITVGDKGGEVLSAQADLKTSSGDVRHAPPDKSTWQAKLYSGEMLNGFERAVMNAEINAGIVRSSSDSENGDELDAAMAQGWDERTL
jgi:hypothetical protein